jgi:hypothetical protein
MNTFSVAFLCVSLLFALVASNSKVLETNNKVEVYLDLEEPSENLPPSLIQTTLKKNKVKSLSYSQKSRNKKARKKNHKKQF